MDIAETIPRHHPSQIPIYSDKTFLSMTWRKFSHMGCCPGSDTPMHMQSVRDFCGMSAANCSPCPRTHSKRHPVCSRLDGFVSNEIWSSSIPRNPMSTGCSPLFWRRPEIEQWRVQGLAELLGVVVL
jgi:hypothetical protein